MNEKEFINELLDIFFNDVRYLNRKEVMYRLKSPLTIDMFWPKLLEKRKENKIDLEFKDQKYNPFWFILTDTIKDFIVIIDENATNNIFEKTSPQVQQSVILNALIDEAFNSSVIEGAFSTKRKTREMVEKNIAPKNKSEQMIINNYRALEFILENLDKPINEEMILSIYNIVIYNTLNEDYKVEKYRDDEVLVMDEYQNLIYEGPDYHEVQALMNQLIKFIINEDDLHPVIKSCIIHFYFVYIHPFFDGNGRTARAISYMYLLKKGYNFFKFFSISSVVNEEKNKYYKAIKDTEDNDSDLTYFINFYTKMMVSSIVRILESFEREFKRRIIDKYLDSIGVILSKRQKKVIDFYLKVDKNFIDVEEYKKKYKVAYETARTDLNQLVKIGLFKKLKQGKKFIYVMVNAIDLFKTLDDKHSILI